MDNLKYVANDMNRYVGDLVEFAGDRLINLSNEDKARFAEICDQLDAVQKRIDTFACAEEASDG